MRSPIFSTFKSHSEFCNQHDTVQNFDKVLSNNTRLKDIILPITRAEGSYGMFRYLHNAESFKRLTGTHSALDSIGNLVFHADFLKRQANGFLFCFFGNNDYPLIISDEELELLYPGKPVANFSTEYPQAEWVLTCGGDRGEVWKNGTLIALQKFKAVTVVIDSSAAGDAFIATYIAEKLAATDPLKALRCAHAIAFQVVRTKGSIVPIDLSKPD